MLRASTALDVELVIDGVDISSTTENQFIALLHVSLLVPGRTMGRSWTTLHMTQLGLTLDLYSDELCRLRESWRGHHVLPARARIDRRERQR